MIGAIVPGAPCRGRTRLDRGAVRGGQYLYIAIGRYYGSGSLVDPAQGVRRRHPRAPAGAAGARGTDRGRALGHHPAGPAARVHPPGQAQGSRPGPRPPRRRFGLLPLRRGRLDATQRELWRSLREGSDDPLLRQDAERVPSVLAIARRRAELGRHRGRRHGTPLFARPHLGSAGAYRAAAAGNRRRAGHRLRRRRAGRTAGAACQALCLRRHQRARGRRRRRAPAPLRQRGSARRRHACPALQGRAASTWSC